MQIPEEIEILFRKRAADWTDAERTKVTNWIYKGYYYKYLLAFGKYHLGSWANHADAENKLQDFWEKKWKGVIQHHDPSKLSFEIYLGDCLKKFSWSDPGVDGERARKRREKQRERKAEQNTKEIESSQQVPPTEKPKDAKKNEFEFVNIEGQDIPCSRPTPYEALAVC
jgi:hypothetical protein